MSISWQKSSEHLHKHQLTNNIVIGQVRVGLGDTGSVPVQTHVAWGRKVNKALTLNALDSSAPKIFVKCFMEYSPPPSASFNSPYLSYVRVNYFENDPPCSGTCLLPEHWPHSQRQLQQSWDVSSADSGSLSQTPAEARNDRASAWVGLLLSQLLCEAASLPSPSSVPETKEPGFEAGQRGAILATFSYGSRDL